MSKYTTEVRFICETAAGLKTSEGYNSIDNILTMCASKIFDFDFPIFDENYRLTLEKKILKHYYTREISEETVGLWKLRLDSKLNEIMPYYNKLYESELLKFNPLYYTDMTTERTGHSVNDRNLTTTDDNTRNTEYSDADDIATTRNEDKTNTLEERIQGTHSETANDSKNTVKGGTDTETKQSDNKNDTWELFSDTPQGSIQGLKDENYLTSAKHTYGNTTGSNETNVKNYGGTESVTGEAITSGSDNTTKNAKDNGKLDIDERTTKGSTGTAKDIFTGTQKNFGTVTGTDTYTERVYGYGGISPATLIKEFRESLINIDMMIIEELAGLFFLLW